MKVTMGFLEIVPVSKDIEKNSKICVNYIKYASISVRGGAVGRGTALQTGRLQDQYQMVSLEFFIDIILPAALWPWSRLIL
jgi:hypothetical protein